MFHLFLFVLVIACLLTVLEYKLQENSDFCLFYCIPVAENGEYTQQALNIYLLE